MSTFSRREILKAGAAWGAGAALINLTGSYGYAGDDPYADAVMVKGEPPKLADRAFTIAVLPDTQNYCEKFPEQFMAQTKWIAENKKDRKIACVLHLGDITNHNTPEQWPNAVKAMNQLDGIVPYFMVPGNHDYSKGGSNVDRSTGYNEYFPLAKFKDLPSFGGVYDQEPERYENSYHLFNSHDMNFVVIALEYGPRKDVVRWANEVAKKHSDRAAILITHAYMYSDDTRYDWKKYGQNQNWNPHYSKMAEVTKQDVSDGEELWTNLVSMNPNFLFTLNGHVLHDGLGRTATKGAGELDVTQMLVNFQMKPNGGDGWLRLIEMRPDEKIAQTYDYSPTRNERNSSPQNEFKYKLAT
ncbi:MAG: metallophosphoesterase [Planctomycetota bacterium]|nr:metallophosphoesterase [Planctomycetota bacterium]